MNFLNKTLLFILLMIVITSLSGCLNQIFPPITDKDFTLSDLNGNSFTLSNNLGKPILLCFFLSTCPHCANEVPHLNAVYNKYKDSHNLLVIGIGVGSSSNISEFAETHDIQYPVLVDQSQKVADLYNVRSVPHNVFINQRGKIVREEIGELTEAELELYLQEIL